MKHSSGRGAWICVLLSLVSTGIAGYHPFAEDGGVYLAGVKKLLRPELYPVATEFVTEHLRFSLFAPLVAAFVRVSHLPLAWVMLGLYVISVWATLWSGWMLAGHLATGAAGRVGAVALLACWLTLPIAGTSLMLLDPYVTARSLVLPLCLWALAWALQARWLPVLLTLGAAACLHPLMAGYGIAAVLTVWSVRRGKLAMTGFVGAGLLLAVALQGSAPAESADYMEVELTRYYWFLSRWHWYEVLGIIAPLALLVWLGRRQAGAPILSQGMVLLGGLALAIALLFCREDLATHLVARMQPLRCFQLVYVVMIVQLGAWLGDHWLRRRLWLAGPLLLCLGAVMLFTQRQIYAHSAHFEWPGASPENAWEQAFMWARENTAVQAVFALDARYITRGPGEDAQCFRALAERSALPDYSKDGGEAAITPSLTEAWKLGEKAQEHLETEDDAARLQALEGTGADWAVLESAARTHWQCPYQNVVVKVCRVARKSDENTF